MRPRTALVLSVAVLLGLASSSLAHRLEARAVSASGPTNLLPNPSFESGGGPNGPAGWTGTGSLTGGGTPAWESGTAHSGSRSVSLTGGSGNWTSAAVVPGPAGAYRAVSAWALVPSQGSNGDAGDVKVTFLNSLGLEVSHNTTGNVASNCNSYYYTWAGLWCFSFSVVVVPSGTVTATVTLETTAGGGKWFFDDVFLGQVVSDAVAAGSQLDVPSPAGTASVAVNASQVVRSLPSILAGDNALYRSTSLAGRTDDPVLTAAMSNHSRPGILRFPGGDNAPTYDWEHPQSGNGTNAVVDIDAFMRYVRASGTGDVLWTVNFAGTAGAFTAKYTGNASTASLSISSSALDVALSGQTDGTSNLHIDFSLYPTIGAVVDKLSATAGYSGAMVSGETDRRRDPVTDELVKVTGVDAKGGPTIQVDVGNVHKALRLEDYANNPNSTVIGPNNLTRNQALVVHGLPAGPYNIHYFEIGNETYNTPAMTPLTPPDNARKVASFAQALHAQDAAVKVGMPNVSFVGDTESCCGAGGAQYVFNQVVDSIAGPYLDFVVDHPYENFHVTYDGMQAFPQHLRRIHNVLWDQETFAMYSPDHRTNIGVFSSEFNLVDYGTNSTSPASSPDYQFVNGLVTADELGVLMTQGTSEASIWDQLDYPFGTHVVWGSNPTSVAEEASGYALEIYNQHFGSQLIQDTYQSPTYDIPTADAPRASVQPGGSGSSYPWQTSYASLSADGSKLYLILINKSGSDPLVLGEQDMPLSTSITLAGFSPLPSASVWTLNGTGRGAYNVTSTVGTTTYDPTAYGITMSTISNASASFYYTTPAHSVTLIQFSH